MLCRRQRTCAPRVTDGSPATAAVGLWSRARPILLPAAVAVMALFALVKLALEFPRLIGAPGALGAIDLKFRYDEVAAWFAGLPAYGETTAIYPPATYPLLWPFLGWLSWPAARVLWAISTIAMLVWFGRLLVNGSGARTPIERWFVLLLLLSANATGITIGNGQLTLHLLAPLVAGSLLLLPREGATPNWPLAAVLLAIGMAKPTLAPPFLVLALVTPGGWRALAVSGAAYVGLTMLGAAFQHESPVSLVRAWLHVSKSLTAGVGYGNLHSLVHTLGLPTLALPSSLLALAAQTAWTWVHRRAEPWLLLGVAALTARFWAYHLPYDDLLALVPMVALFRIAMRESESPAWRLAAGALVAIMMVAMLLPARIYFWWSEPWPAIYALSHTIPWLITLGVLMWKARRPA